MERLKRKIDEYLIEWKKDEHKLPLIIKGARQIGKTNKGALYENIIGDMLVKTGYQLYFYKDDSKKIEMDFMIRDKQSLIPVEVKANDNATISLNNLINNNLYKDIKYGIKLCNKNIGFNGKFYTFPYFLTFLLKRFLEEKK